MNELKPGDIVFALQNGIYRHTHPINCYFGVVLGYQSKDLNDIIVATIHQARCIQYKSSGDVLNIETLSLEKFSLLQNIIKQLDPIIDAHIIKTYLHEYLLNRSSIYPVRAKFFQKLPDTSFQDFKEKYYEIAKPYFRHHTFDTFSMEIMKPLESIYSLSSSYPQFLMTNLPKQSL